MVIDARGQSLDFEKLSKDLCARTGADGFMAIDDSNTGDFRLHFYNSDGSRGEMCGNGARCICKFAYDHGIAGETMVVETDAGLVPGWRLSENQYRVQLNNPSVLDLLRKENAAYVELGNPGIPHAVVEMTALEFGHKEALLQQAIGLRYDPAFPKGANINFFTFLEDSIVRVLTYERGVEDYTLACGTGSGSIACVLHARGRLPHGRLTCQSQGGTLQIELREKDGQINSIFLEGTTEILGIYDL
jgi:diaminopimelate epimerase